ncbi:hypothetical protein Sru01_38580 [Sphaerisporangium rufum]|uniref:SGNH/GDSL hydrolase family protein n=1 Tax=Sphaerisporangium rufum TaxID=1381558 RepID=A0A919R371_9ACTN|nr:SGNH/GDSL hydrolase family protein [Sphaerisporangium rufum]GII78876.1 hypothetical protein Sru01_38580 [Sphaerisporangium rufum]
MVGRLVSVLAAAAVGTAGAAVPAAGGTAAPAAAEARAEIRAEIRAQVGAGGRARGRAAAEPVPAVMAALGDSITAGFNACGWYAACPARSWSTGDAAGVRSHYLRLLALDPALRGHNLNFAVPGATSAGLAAQAARAVAARAGYVTVLIGAQDACSRRQARMTPVATYRARITRAFALLATTGTKIFAASVPDLWRLWRIGRDNMVARSFWAIGHICPAMLADAASDARADRLRRARVRARVRAYNAAMAEVCAAYGPGCRYDGGAVFDYPFTLDHVSAWDFFHPDDQGQRALAEVTYAAGFRWDAAVAPAPQAARRR